MTDEENEKILDEYWEAWDSGDLEAVLNLFTDDVIFIAPSGTEYDKQGLHRIYEIAFNRIEPREYFLRNPIESRRISKGNTVVVEGTFSGTCPDDPEEKVEKMYAIIVYDFKAGKIKNMNYWTKEG